MSARESELDLTACDSEQKTGGTKDLIKVSGLVLTFEFEGTFVSRSWRCQRRLGALRR